MKRNRFTVAQIIRMLREAEVHVSRGDISESNNNRDYAADLPC